MNGKLWTRIALFAGAAFLVAITGAIFTYKIIQAGLPEIITVEDYKPLLVSHVYDRNGVKIGEFAREHRTLVPFDKIPKHVVNAFLAAEDDQFYEHSGINYVAILRATIANLKAGRSVQGGSTITQQVAKTLMLSPEKTLIRKAREAMLAKQMEKNLSKDEILYLYLNQIFFGQRAYGIENASQTYFRKTVSDLTVEEAALLAGLPQAPSRYSPVNNPSRAKERQIYVLRRMGDVGYIPAEDVQKYIDTPVKLFLREDFIDHAPFFLETVRVMLVQQLGEKAVLDEGLSIHTSLDFKKQQAAKDAAMRGLKDLDKRQGYRGPLKNLTVEEDIEKLLLEQKERLVRDFTPERILLPDGTFEDLKPEVTKKNQDALLPFYIKIGDTVEGVVEKVDDAKGLVFVRIPEAQGVIDFESMKWARKPDPSKRFDMDMISKASQAVKKGDVILVSIASDRASVPERLEEKAKTKKANAAAEEPDFKELVGLELDQIPDVEGALISFDQQTQDILAMVGGYKFIPQKNEFNRAIQAARQTGSAFKTIVYASALDKGYNPSTPIMDAPIVYDESIQNEEGQEENKVWKPSNHGKTFGGEITFRNALVRSLNVPTVKIIEDVTVPWAMDYAHRLGIFNPLNPDFTLALGSSSVTLYEMTKVFSTFGRLGKRIRPLLIHKVLDKDGNEIMGKLSLDIRFEKQIQTIDDEYQKRREAFFASQQENADQQVAEETKKSDQFFFHQDPDQLIRPQTAYVMTSILKGVVEDPRGTGQRARALGREVAGKTGSTNGYFDAWFIGYTAQIATGVWVGFDSERSLGRSEVGGRSALPIWIDYMKEAHEGLPQMTMPVPEGIVFANVDSETGKLASALTKNVLRQAFIEGTEPTSSSSKEEEETDFFKQDLSE